MTPAYAAQLGLNQRPTNIGAQEINDSALKTYGMTTAGFLVEDKRGRTRFFEKTFLLADISMEVILGMPFFSFSHVDIDFKTATEELTWRTYTTTEAIPTARQVELIDKYEFVKVALDENLETFVVYIVAVEVSGMTIHPSRAKQVPLDV